MRRARLYNNLNPSDDAKMPNEEFLKQYNKEIDEAESEIDTGNYLTQDQVRQYFADKRTNGGGSRDYRG